MILFIIVLYIDLNCTAQDVGNKDKDKSSPSENIIKSEINETDSVKNSSTEGIYEFYLIYMSL